METTILENLTQVLEEERSALLSGKLDQLQGLLEQKQEILGSLESESMSDADALRNLQTKMLRNQSLLESALQGVRNVSQRIETARKIRETLNTYDHRGNYTEVKLTSSQKLEKRA